MPLPFRNNPKITTNWVHSKTKNTLENKTKKAYYDISITKEPGRMVILLREEKKRLGGSAEREEFWFGQLAFDLDSKFARDLKMFLDEWVKEDAPEIKERMSKEKEVRF